MFRDGPLLFQNGKKTWFEWFGIKELEWTAWNLNHDSNSHYYDDFDCRFKACPSCPKNELLTGFAQIPTKTKNLRGC